MVIIYLMQQQPKQNCADYVYVVLGPNYQISIKTT
jgi:hypothetical protein